MVVGVDSRFTITTEPMCHSLWDGLSIDARNARFDSEKKLTNTTNLYLLKPSY